MGCNQSTIGNDHGELTHLSPISLIKAASLNYCGILKSPFQFYSGKYQDKLKQLSAIFEQLKPKYVCIDKTKPFEWSFSAIDRQIKDQRYSPLYNIMAGIENNKFISRERFCQIWKDIFNKSVKGMKIPSNQAQVQEALQFDLLCFQTFLNYVYKIQDLEQALNLNPQQYIQTLNQFQSQVFMNEDKKLSLFLQELANSESADVVFLQEVELKLIEKLTQLGKYHLAVSDDQNTLIIAKKTVFKYLHPKDQYYSKLTQTQKDSLNWNSHSSVMFVDKYILISGHLSSKKAITLLNLETLKKSMMMLRQKFPDHEIICGIDANIFVECFNSEIHLFPSEKNTFTTYKKRTAMQTQSSKAEIAVRQAKDHIMTTLSIIQGQITTISGEKHSEQNFLPTDDHPFDHLLVYSILKPKHTVL